MPINVKRLKPPETIHSPLSGLWKNCLPQNWSLVPIRLGTAALAHLGLSEDALEGVLCSMSLSSAAVLAVECEGWDFPRVWDRRLITVSPRELKLLSLSLPNIIWLEQPPPQSRLLWRGHALVSPWPAARKEGRAERQRALQPEVRPPQAQDSGSGGLVPRPQKEAGDSAEGVCALGG